MAKDLKTDGAAPPPNADARADVMRECASDMEDIIEQRHAINQKAGKIRERLRECGHDVPSFMAALRLKGMEDDAARDTYIEGLREAFLTLNIGTQGQLFSG